MIVLCQAMAQVSKKKEKGRKLPICVSMLLNNGPECEGGSA